MRQIKVTISELSVITGLHRHTISKRLKGLESLLGGNNKKKIYDLNLALKLIVAIK